MDFTVLSGITVINLAPTKAKMMLGIPKRMTVLKSILFQKILILKRLLKRWKQATRNTAIFRSKKLTATGMRSVELPNPASVAPMAARKETNRKITSPAIVSPSYYISVNFKTINSTC
jgi:hypothetical protein